MSASVELVCVHPSQIADTWRLVGERLRGAMLRTDLNHTADLEHSLFKGDGVLWLAIADGSIVACAATVLVKTDRHLVCLITALSGEKMGLWLDLLGGIEDWARSEGAAKVRVYGRSGWARVLKDYHVSNVVLERVL